MRGRDALNCRHCGTPNPNLPLGSSQAGWVCQKCGAQLFSDELLETRSMMSSEFMQFEMPARFRADKVVGEGSFGVVSKCWDTVLQRDVAVKFPKDGSFQKDLFLREARAASRLQHENIVRIFDVGEQNGQAYIVSEFVDGKTLRAWLDRSDHSMDDVLQMMARIARGIHYAHENGIIHRDLKPGNIMVNQADQPRILDFGLSRSMYSEEDTIMKPGQRVGTPAFMAPEQVRGDVDEIDERTDVYSLGVILFQLLVRQLPYSGSVNEVFEAIAQDDGPPSLRSRNHSIPAPLEAICQKAMAKRPAERYRTAQNFAVDIERYLEGHSLTAYPGLHSRRVKRIMRRSWLASAAVISLLVAVGGGWWIVSDYNSRNPLLPVVVQSDPAGAALVWTRFDPAMGVPEAGVPVKSVAGDVVRLRPGFYRVVARTNDDFVEVFRTVPESPESGVSVNIHDGEIIIPIPHRSASWEGNRFELPRIVVIPVAEVNKGMTYIPGGSVSVAENPGILAVVSGQTRPLGDFLVDPGEVTWQQIIDTWNGYEPGEGKEPGMAVEGLSWDLAVVWVEANGKCLPSIWELQFAATNGGTTRYPSGDKLPEPGAGPDRDIEIARWDQTTSNPPVCGLLGSRSEWTCDPFVMLIKKDDQLVPYLPSVATSAGSGQPQSFPSNFYVFSALNFSKAGEPQPFGNLVNVADVRLFSNLGFRAVRRLHIPDFPNSN